MCVATKNGCFEVSFSYLCIGEFQHEKYNEVSAGQIQELSVSLKVKLHKYSCDFSALVGNSKYNGAIKIAIMHLLEDMLSQQNLCNSDLSHPVPSIESSSG